MYSLYTLSLVQMIRIQIMITAELINLSAPVFTTDVGILLSAKRTKGIEAITT